MKFALFTCLIMAWVLGLTANAQPDIVKRTIRRTDGAIAKTYIRDDAGEIASPDSLPGPALYPSLP
jgi:hypothetical protein